MTLYLISLSIFLLYILAAILKFGVPKSLSETYYLFRTGKVLFWIWSVVAVLPLTMFWFDKLEGTNIQALAFFGCTALIFVTTAGDFKHKSQEKTHYIAAGLCALLSHICLFIFAPMMILVAIPVFVGCWILGGISGTYRDNVGLAKHKNSLLFWLEMGCFINVYIGLVLF